MSLRKPKGLTYNHDLVHADGTVQTVKYRAFNTGEQKDILTAIAMKDTEALLNKTLDVVEACTFNELKVRNLPMYLVDNMFLKINSKSTGTKQQASWTCGAHVDVEGEDEPHICGGKLGLILDMDRAYIHYPENFEHRVTIDVDDEQKITMRLPTFEDFSKIDTKKEWMDILTQFIFACTEAIIDGDDIKVPGADFNYDEAVEWIDGLDADVLTKIEAFYNSLPATVLDVNVTCPKCGKKEEIRLTGLEDFFM